MKKRNSLLAAILGATTLSGLAACGDDTSGISFNRIEDCYIILSQHANKSYFNCSYR